MIKYRIKILYTKIPLYSTNQKCTQFRKAWVNLFLSTFALSILHQNFVILINRCENFI